MTVGEYCMNWVWYGGWFWKVLRGIPVPKLLTFPADFKFSTITHEQFKRCMNAARDKMLIEHIIYPDAYIPDAFDCANFSICMKDYFDQSYAELFGKDGFGIPTRVYPYSKDTGEGHCVVEVMVEGKPIWCGPYPQAKFYKQQQLTMRERATFLPLGRG